MQTLNSGSNEVLSLPLIFPPGSILIDNSTYFSVKASLQETNLSAQVVYNMANFFECLVLADKVFLSPTTIWRPRQEDTLFSEKGPCAQIDITAWDDEILADLFSSAIQRSIRDLKDQETRIPFWIDNDSLGETKQLLKSWKSVIRSDPGSFLSTYSGVVHWTDPASAQFLDGLQSSVDASMPPYRHLGQYLLRCNVAFELSEYLPYHPHSSRVPFVSKKLELANRASEALATSLLRETELEINKMISSKARDAFLRSFRGFRLQFDLPLILAVILASTDSPENLVSEAINLRNIREAKRYRLWIRKLLTSVQSEDWGMQAQAKQEWREARLALANELAKLYGERQNKVIERSAGFMGTLDSERLASLNWKGLLVDFGKKSLESAPTWVKGFGRNSPRRRIGFIIGLAKKRRSLKPLNILLEKVFQKSLPPIEIRNLEILLEDRNILLNNLLKTAN